MGILQNISSWFNGGASPSASVVEEGAPIWYGPGGSYVDTQAGERVTEYNLMSSATCFACCKALAESVAGLPATVYKVKNTIREEDPTSEAWKLLIDQPNPEMDWFTFSELMVTRIMNQGNFFAEIQRDNADRPVALWPIHPSRVTALRDPEDSSLYWEVKHDWTGDADYQDPTWRKRNLTFLSPHNMLNIVGFGSQNGIISSGVIPGAQEVGIDFAARRYGANFFSSGATPIGVVEHPAFIANEGTRSQFRADLNRIHNNKNGGNQIGVLWQGATYKQISLAPEQAQFLETRKFTSQQICKLYGVPPTIIGDYEHSKFATADAMLRAFVMVTLRNLVVRIEKAINRQVLHVNSEGVLKKAFTRPQVYELALDGLLRGDPKMQAETWRMMRESGVASANEWRDSIGMNPIQGKEGDYLIVPGGFARLDKIDNQGTRVQQSQQEEKPEEKPEEKEEDAKRLPTFDKEALIELFHEAGISVHQPQQDSIVDNVAASLKIGIQKAVDRIHHNTIRQTERWKTQDPETVMNEKVPEFVGKQRDRVEDAISPMLDIALASGLVVNDVASLYEEYLLSIDFHDWFSLSDGAPVNIEISNAAAC